MPELSIIRPHNLGIDEAKRRINSLLAETVLEGKITAPSWTWTNYVAVVKFGLEGFSFTGQLTVNENSVEVSATLPIIALPFRTRVTKVITDRLDQALNTKRSESVAKKKMGSSGASGDTDSRVKQLGAVVEILWFFVASVGMHIAREETDFECCKEGAAKAREQVEKYATEADLESCFPW